MIPWFQKKIPAFAGILYVEDVSFCYHSTMASRPATKVVAEIKAEICLVDVHVLTNIGKP
jgi:hypothetical protein